MCTIRAFGLVSTATSPWPSWYVQGRDALWPRAPTPPRDTPTYSPPPSHLHNHQSRQHLVVPPTVTAFLFAQLSRAVAFARVLLIAALARAAAASASLEAAAAAAVPPPVWRVLQMILRRRRDWGRYALLVCIFGAVCGMWYLFLGARKGGSDAHDGARHGGGDAAGRGDTTTTSSVSVSRGRQSVVFASVAEADGVGLGGGVGVRPGEHSPRGRLAPAPSRTALVSNLKSPGAAGAGRRPLAGAAGNGTYTSPVPDEEKREGARAYPSRSGTGARSHSRGAVGSSSSGAGGGGSGARTPLSGVWCARLS